MWCGDADADGVVWCDLVWYAVTVVWIGLVCCDLVIYIAV